MAKIKVEGFLYLNECRDYDAEMVGCDWPMKVVTNVYPFDSNDKAFGLNMGFVSFEHELPEGFNAKDALIQNAVAALQERKAKALAEYQSTVSEINEQLSKLQAIEYVEAA